VFGIGGKSDHDTFLVGLVNSAPYIASAFIGCWISDPLNYQYVHHSFDHAEVLLLIIVQSFGRRGTIFFAATFCLLSVIGSAFTQTWLQLFICRLLLGVGMGSKASTVPIYAAENSPAAIRGALVMSWQYVILKSRRGH
jgi:MFS family permease